jgi:serine phosphatase RsbU (regulator of sigma subunit)
VISFDPGTTVLAFTDGISEALNCRNELLGIERLFDCFKSAPDGPERIGAEVINLVDRFVGGHPQSDDMALVCFGRAGQETGG